MELTNVLKDDHGRSINYLRLSVTDRCNLRCRYCMPQKNFTFLPRQDILSYEEMLQIITVADKLKISKLRLTGGEPLVRRDFIGFLGRIRRLHPELDIRLTTNGTLLEKFVPALLDLGITCVNVSLDTLKAEKFAHITGRDLFHRVWRGLELAVDQGLRLKINAVAMKGFNQEDLPGFMDLARKWPVDVRFIEFMPIGDKCLWEERHFWPASDILARAEELATLSPLEDAGKTHGPARLYTIDGGRGRFGLITPMSSHFCGSCNRLRVTADGRLRTCLFSETEYRLRPLLRSSKLGPDKLLTVLRLASRRKPIGHEVIARELQKAGTQPRRGMSAIGGWATAPEAAMDLIDYERLIQSEELARRHIASFCWPAGGPYCPRCRNTKVYMLYDERMRCSSCKYTFHDLSGRWINAGRLTSRDWIRQLKLFELELTIHKMASQLRQAYNTIYKAVTTIRMALLAQALDGSRILMSPLGREIGFDGTRATLRTTHSPMETIPVFGIIKRSDWVFIDILHHLEAETVFHFNVNFGLKLERMGNIIYTDRYQRYDALVLCGDQRLPYDYIRQRKKRALVDVQLSGFWKFAKPRLQRFNGISPHRFPLYLKELEFRYNHRRDNLFPLMLQSLCAFVPRVEQ